MANPNLATVTSILGTTETFDLTTTLTSLVTCASDKVCKINSIMISNIDGTNAADFTLKVYNGTTDRSIASTISVPADSTLVASDKNSYFYLQEGFILKGQASADSDLQCLVSYEIMDDA